MTKNKRPRGRPAADISHPSTEDQAEIQARREADVARYYADPDVLRQWARITRNSARTRAAAQDVAFDLSVDDLVEMARETPRCPVFGLSLSYGRGNWHSRPHSASLDRIVPSEGYTRANCIVLSALPIAQRRR